MLMIWRLEAMAARGLEGTVIGTLVMPYASGAGNLFFVWAMLRHGGAGEEVLINSLVNNATNLTLLLGLPAVIWGLSFAASGRPKSRGAKESRLNRLSVALNLAAAIFFAGMAYALGLNGTFGLAEGLVLVGIFIFWQVFQVFDVLKTNVVTNRRLSPWLAMDALAVVLCGVLVFVSVDAVVAWLQEQEGGFLSRGNLGWITGWLMVLPNALLAGYYAARKQGSVVLSSQVGDGHISIPLCVGLYAIFEPIRLPEWAGQGFLLLAGVAAVHLVLVLVLRGVPRWIGILLIGAYGYFLWLGWV